MLEDMGIDPALLPDTGLPRFPSLDNTLGAILIGAGISSILAGVSVHQTFRYFRRYPQDHISCQITVVILCLLDVLHEVLIVHMCYFYLVTSYFQPLKLLTGVWSLRLVIPTTGVISMVSHVFFTRRVLILTGSRRIIISIASLTALLILAEGAFCSATTAFLFLDDTFERFVAHSSWLICTALGIRVATDLVVSGAMIHKLRSSRTGFRRTDSVLDLLIFFAINTGLLTSLINLAAVVTAILFPHALIYCGIYLVSSKLYSNSVLAVLNSRRSRNKTSAENQDTGHGTTWMEMSERISAACHGTESETAVYKPALDNAAKTSRSSRVHSTHDTYGIGY